MPRWSPLWRPDVPFISKHAVFLLSCFCVHRQAHMADRVPRNKLTRGQLCPGFTRNVGLKDTEAKGH